MGAPTVRKITGSARKKLGTPRHGRSIDGVGCRKLPCPRGMPEPAAPAEAVSWWEGSGPHLGRQQRGTHAGGDDIVSEKSECDGQLVAYVRVTGPYAQCSPVRENLRRNTRHKDFIRTDSNERGLNVQAAASAVCRALSFTKVQRRRDASEQQAAVSVRDYGSSPFTRDAPVSGQRNL
jgi:hypothetical protein